MVKLNNRRFRRASAAVGGHLAAIIARRGELKMNESHADDLENSQPLPGWEKFIAAQESEEAAKRDGVDGGRKPPTQPAVKLPPIEECLKVIDSKYIGGASTTRLQGAKLMYRYLERQLQA
jgi:hypothetical protein